MDKLEDLIKTMQRVCKCPVCWETLEHPIAQCGRGHAVCCRCRERLSICPVCRANFTVTTSNLAKSFVEAIPRFCKNRNNGCESISSSEHDPFCAFRQIQCNSCEWIGVVIDLERHYLLNHVSDILNQELTIKVEGIATAPNEEQKKYYLYPHFEQLFLVEETRNSEFFCAYKIAVIPLKKPDDYNLSFNCKTGDNQFDETDEIPIYDDVRGFSAINDFFFKIPRDNLLVNDRDVLSGVIHIGKMDIQ